MKLYFVCLFILMAIFFLVIGVKVIVSKKPMLIPAKLFFVFMVLAFSPQLVNFFAVFGTEAGNRMGFILYLNPLIYTVLLIFFWVQMKGYVVIGIYDDTFRNAIHSSLHKNQISFEEQLSVIKLTATNESLQVAVQSWVGTAQLKLKKSNNENLLYDVALGMNQYFLENDIKANNITAIFYIVMGALMLAASGGFAFAFT